MKLPIKLRYNCSIKPYQNHLILYQTFKQKNNAMKTISQIFKNTMLIVIIFSFSIVNAQKSDNNSSTQTESVLKPTCIYVSFATKHIDNKVYLNWEAKNLKEDCIYFIQRSDNNVDFQAIGTINGVIVEPDIIIQYCYTDTRPIGTKSYYRIVTIKNLGEDYKYLSQIVDEQNNIYTNKIMYVSNK